MRRYTLLLILTLLILLCVAPVEAQGPNPPAVPPPSDRPSAQRGRDLWAQNCAPCHGQTGRGDGETMRSQGRLAPSFAAPAFQFEQSPAAIYSVVSEGRIDRLMPPWKGRLTPDQMWDVSYYSWWLGAGPRSLSRGQTVWQAECASCHGANGASLANADLSKPGATLNRSQADLAVASARVTEHAPVWAKLKADDQKAALDYARSLSFETPPLPPTNGVVQGTIRNGTQNAAVSAGQVVTATLYSFVGTDEDPVTVVPVAPDGSFKFEGLVTDPNYGYGVGARYNNIEYFSPLVRFPANETVQTAALTVYDTTTTNPGVRLGRAHVIADFLDGRTLRVGELYQVDNPSQRTYVAAPGATTFELTLPPGVMNVRFQEEGLDAKRLQQGDTLKLDLAWPPGTRQLVLTYDIPYNGNLQLTRSLPYPAGEVNVLVADTGIQARSTGTLQQGSPLEPPGGGRFLTFSAANVPANQPLALTISGTPRVAQPAPGAAAGANNAPTAVAPVPTSYQTALLWLAVALAGLAVLSVFVWPRLRPAYVVDQRSRHEDQKERLLDRLADLDDAYAAGEMTETSYTVQRADTKARLVAVMRQLEREEKGA